MTAPPRPDTAPGARRFVNPTLFFAAVFIASSVLVTLTEGRVVPGFLALLFVAAVSLVALAKNGWPATRAAIAIGGGCLVAYPLASLIGVAAGPDTCRGPDPQETSWNACDRVWTYLLLNVVGIAFLAVLALGAVVLVSLVRAGLRPAR